LSRKTEVSFIKKSQLVALDNPTNYHNVSVEKMQKIDEFESLPTTTAD
jgi:hypothetical protein